MFTCKLTTLVCSVLAFMLLMSMVAGLPAVQAQTPSGTIAYVRGDTRDEIRLIEPSGSNDRLLWTHGQDDPKNVYEIWSLAWRPNASEITFASTHENACSIMNSDLYTIGSDGSGYRRMTMGPACRELANYPKGTVRIPVKNSSTFGESIDVFLYFLGAPGEQQVSLPPGGSTVVTFENVADFGDEVQFAVVIEASNRELLASTAADVQPGKTVETATTTVFRPSTPGFEAHAPSWRADSSKLGFAFNFDGLRSIEPHPGPLDLGNPLAEPTDMPNFVRDLTYSPAPARAAELLYIGWTFDAQSIYLIKEGSATAGEPLVSYEPYNTVLDLAWLPDGSGFVYSLKDHDLFEAEYANIYEYNFATKQAVRLTNFNNEVAGRLSVSPDGQQIVFERAKAIIESTFDLDNPDLWIMNRDGSGMRLLVKNGRAPAWSPQTISAPPPAPTPGTTPTPTPGAPPATPIGNQRVYLPMVRR